MRLINLTGQKFGRLTVTGRSLNRGRRTMWACECECGTAAIASAVDLKRGHAQSCGCLRVETARRTRTTHGGSRSLTYESWRRMLARCYRKGTPDFHRYGGRGIRVCERWRESFAKFLADMGPRPSRLHSIDRYPNKDGHYEPENCRWATAKEQSRNRDFAKPITAFGRTQFAVDWAKEYGSPVKRIWSRISAGWNPEDAISTPALHGSRWDKTAKNGGIVRKGA